LTSRPESDFYFAVKLVLPVLLSGKSCVIMTKEDAISLARAHLGEAAPSQLASVQATRIDRDYITNNGEHINKLRARIWGKMRMPTPCPRFDEEAVIPHWSVHGYGLRREGSAPKLYVVTIDVYDDGKIQKFPAYPL
jgi:hypothetical protein